MLRPLKLITGSAAARLGVALMAVGLFAVPCAKAETKLSTADKGFILATAQGGVTEVKLGDPKALQSARSLKSLDTTFGRQD